MVTLDKAYNITNRYNDMNIGEKPVNFRRVEEVIDNLIRYRRAQSCGWAKEGLQTYMDAHNHACSMVPDELLLQLVSDDDESA